ncbi:RrF2 family transcriptional regulator [Butyrivibrio sp. JL13D10]|uniref:RrF2 family transcriptional regulator n=1 Tax=Butyrivibrio sp. JL13D10 TaxID=3236815 RepID=UPI0038B5B45A
MFSTKGRYALRIMIDLAEQNQEELVPLKDTADRIGVSKKYLEIIAKELVKAKLIIASSGKHGGYRLTRSPEEYSVGEIIELLEGPIVPIACLLPDSDECPREKSCPTLPMWKEFAQLEHDFFFGKKLSDLI